MEDTSVIQLGNKKSDIEYPEYLFELLQFFPIDKLDLNTGVYDQYLFDLQKTISDNHEKGNYQVAYFYSHFMFMSYVYYSIEKVLELEPKRIKDVYFPINAYAGRTDKPELEEYKSIYDFSKIPEKDIFKIFHVMGMPPEQIKNLAKYISTRDDFAHATGKGNITEEELENNIRIIKGHMDIIYQIFVHKISDKYIDFLKNTFLLEFSELTSTFEEFIFDNHFSFLDINLFCNLGLSKYRDTNDDFKKNYRHIKQAHRIFIQHCMENHNISEPTGYKEPNDDAYLYNKYSDDADSYIKKSFGN